jgi:transglutaminase-like putative cysteine protease
VSSPEIEGRPPTALMPVWAARLVGFTSLAALAALEWQRMIGGLSSGRALLWVAVAVGGATAVVACSRLRGRARAVGPVVLAGATLVAAVLVSGIDLALLKPREWGATIEGAANGLQSLGTVRLPYAGSDPWPGIALELSGALLLAGAGLVSVWPRGGERGYPFMALVALLVLVAAPVISLGGARPVFLGAILTALLVCFLWLERLPLRPGLGVAALLGVALAGALPLAAVADQGEPWFDYKAFAEGLGPDDPVRFVWNQEYGPIDWPRDGNEVMRVKTDQPSYWKARNLETFDGRGWVDTPVGDGRRGWEDEVPDDWRNRPGWTSTAEVSVRRMRTRDVIGAGTIMDVTDTTRPVSQTRPGRWESLTEMRRGDSYTVRTHVPRPVGGQVRETSTGADGRMAEDLVIGVPLKPGRELQARRLGSPVPGVVREARIVFRPYGDEREPIAEFPSIDRGSAEAVPVLRRSLYWRTWKLSQRLKEGTETPYEYLRKVDAYLHQGFSYSERPTPPPRGRAPLDAFLLDTKDGYCQHFSGAMALLLRMGGVPARVATGFSPGGFSARREAWIVRDTDAHAWVEAWYDSFGWATYDPTPEATPARSQIAVLQDPPPLLESASDSAGAVAGGGAGGPIQRAGGVRGDLLFDLQRKTTTASPADDGGGTAWWVWALVAVGVAAAVGLVSFLVIRRRGAGGAGLTPHDRAIAELEAALRRAGRPAPAGTTLRQLEHRLGASPEASAYLRALRAGRYAPTAPPPTAAQRRALRRALATGLGPLGRLRTWWALPPRAR